MTSNLIGRVDSSTLSIRYKRNGVWYQTNGIEAIVSVMNDTQLGDIVAFINSDSSKEPMYKCPSYYDNDNILQNCECGECE